LLRQPIQLDTEASVISNSRLKSSARNRVWTEVDMILRIHKSVLFPILTSAVLLSTALVAPPVLSHPVYTPAYCESYARDLSLRYSRGGAVGGAVRGGLGGAAIGAVVGGGKGARKGAAIGAVTAGTARAVQRGVSYDMIYRDCMRGHFPQYY